MAPLFVQGIAQDAGGGNTSLALAFSSNVTGGNCIIVFCASTFNGATDVTSVTDNKGNTYTKVHGPYAPPAGTMKTDIFVAKNVASGATTVTIHLGSSAPVMAILEYSGLDTTSPFDVAADNEDTNATASMATGTTAATSQASEVSIAFFMAFSPGGDTYTPGTGYTAQLTGNLNNFSVFVEDKVLSSTGTQSTTAVSTTNASSRGTETSMIATFKAASPGIDKLHTADAFVQNLASKTHNADSYIQFFKDKTYNADARIQVDSSKNFNADAYIILQKNNLFTVDSFVLVPPSIQFNVDAFVQFFTSKTHIVDADIFIPSSATFRVDAFLSVPTVSFVRLSASIIFPIQSGNYIKLAGNILTPLRDFVNLRATVKTNSLAFVNLSATFKSSTALYVKLAATIQKGGSPTYSVDASVGSSFCIPVVPAGLIPGVAPQVILPPPPTGLTDACLNQSYVKLAATIVGKSRSFVKLAAWIVPRPGFAQLAPIRGRHGSMPTASGAPAGSSIQMPGNPNFSSDDDFLSSQLALQSYSKNSIFTLSGPSLPAAGISLIVQAFTAGVQSFQTRARSWLKRVDIAPNGVLVKQSQNTHQLPNGNVITTTTQVTQQKDVTITVVIIQNSGTPNRVTKIVTEKTASGQTTTRETDTNLINGVKQSRTKKSLFTTPPTNQNIQPLQVKTLDGIVHYQFFGPGPINDEFAGGDQEGLTTSTEAVTITPGGVLNGKTTDAFGNPIYTQTTVSDESDPTGKTTHTVLEEVGTRRDIGATVTDTLEQFNGIVSKSTKTTNYPDGSASVQITEKNSITGDSIQKTTETATDEFGQITTTVTSEETVTFPDPATGAIRQTITKTVTVTKGAVTTTDTTVTQSNDFDDDIISKKIQVFGIQEFTISCTIDEMNMLALSDVNNTHQRSYALLELFGQQLGNGQLSYALRQQLIKQFDGANVNLSPLNLLALGRNYSVVFAQSASGFRAKYITGTEPHVYELQILLQSRSNIQDGTFGF